MDAYKCEATKGKDDEYFHFVFWKQQLQFCILEATTLNYTT